MQHPAPKLLLFFALGVVPGAALVRAVDAPYTHALAGLYGVVSVISFLQYRADKKRAATSVRRIAERSLHAVELLGGWPGALVAQQVYRHKTRKVRFQMVFWIIVALHQVAWAAWLWRDRL